MVQSAAPRRSAPVRSAHHSTSPNTSVAQPITSAERRASSSPEADRASPARITGTVATIRQAAR